MQIDERTYYEEEQRMESRWIWFFFAFFFISILGIGIGILLNEPAEWRIVLLVLGIIVLSDTGVLLLFRSLKLEIAISKKGFHYNFFALFSNKGTIEWNEIEKISLTKSPYRSYGKKYSFKNGQVFTMNTKMGVKMDLKNGRKKFFSVKDIDDFRSSYKKLELPLILEG